MFRATLKSLLSRKLRLMLSGIAVILGVSFVSGAFVLTDGMGKSFDQLFSQINQKVSVVVQPKDPDKENRIDRPSVPASTLDKVRQVDGVAAVAPQVSGQAAIVDKHNKTISSFGPPRMGYNWDTEDSLRQPNILAGGHAPRGPDQIVVNGFVSDKTGYKVGDTAEVLVAGKPAHRYQIVGVAEYPGGKPSLAGEQSIWFDTATAKSLFDREDSYTQISLKAAPGVSDATLRDRVARVLPTGVEAKTSKQIADDQSSQVKKGLSFFNIALQVFAAVALFVGLFLIFNTFTMLIAQRTRELALFRALGASRRQVNRSVLFEAAVVGFMSSALGLGVGIGLAKLLQWVMNQLSKSKLAMPTVIEARTVIVAFAVGIGVTVLAAMAPAIKASRVPPVAALRDAATPDRPLGRLTAIGGAVLLIGIAGVGWGLFGSAPLLVLGLSCLVTFLGVALMSPLMSRPVAGGLGRLFAWRTPGKLGRRNSVRNPRRTAATAASLMIGLALVSAVGVFGASIKKTINKVTANTVAADYVVDGGELGIPADALQKVKDAPHVTAVVPMYQGVVKVNGNTRFVTTFPSSAMGSMVTLQAKEGSMTLSPGHFLVGENTAKKNHWHPGSTVRIEAAKATSTYTVAGVYKENPLAGNYLFENSLTKSFDRPIISAGLAKLSSGQNADKDKGAVEDALNAYPNVSVSTQSEFAGQATSQIDQLVMMINILLALSLIIALLGIINTLALSVIERTRELGLLRAVGLGRWQTIRMVTVEAVVVALFGAVLGVVVGIGFGVALQHAAAGSGITELAFPTGSLVVYLVLAAIGGVIAAFGPSLRAARLNVLRAIAYE
ncbi:MAG: ABC transporter permease [Mycobacteriales bacterium]